MSVTPYIAPQKKARPIGRAFFLASLLTLGCRERQSENQPQVSVAAASSTESAEPSSNLLVTTYAGPRIEVDSSRFEPRLEARDKAYVLVLPSVTASLLFDSLPAFVPTQLAAYPVVETQPITYLHADVELPSVLIGDFNADSKRDVALSGQSGRRTVTLMLLSKSDSVTTPRILFLNKEKVADGAMAYLGLLHAHQLNDPYEVAPDLQTDAVQRLVPYKSSVVYYLENGVLKSYTHSGD